MLRLLDSFAHYSTSQILSKWTTRSDGAGGSGLTINNSAGRFSGRARFNVAAGNVFSYLTKQFDSQQTWIIGFGFMLDVGATSQSILVISDSGTEQVSLRLDASRHLVVSRAGTTLATGTTVLSVSTWYYIELKVKIDNTTGTYEVRLNGSGTAEITGSGADTQNTANATADQIIIGTNFNSPAVNWDYCDFYACDGQGATNNTFLGDTRVECRFPNGNGTTSGFTGSDGNSVDNYLLVDEANPNDDTDYVEANPTTTKDTYAFQDLVTSSGSVYGVQIGLRARKTDAGAKAIQSVARLSGTEVNSADETLSTSYQYFFDVRETKPGGGAWSISDVNNAEFGEYVSL